MKNGSSDLDLDALAAALARYRADGYAVLRGLFGAAEIAEIASAFDRHRAHGLALGANFRHGNLLYRIAADPKLGKIVRMVQWPAYEDAVLARYRADRRIFAVLEPLLGGDVKQIINQLHWKPPGAGAAE